MGFGGIVMAAWYAVGVARNFCLSTVWPRLISACPLPPFLVYSPIRLPHIFCTLLGGVEVVLVAVAVLRSQLVGCLLAVVAEEREF